MFADRYESFTVAMIEISGRDADINRDSLRRCVGIGAERRSRRQWRAKLLAPGNIRKPRRGAWAARMELVDDLPPFGCFWRRRKGVSEGRLDCCRPSCSL